jgi:hypothetical protein
MTYHDRSKSKNIKMDLMAVEKLLREICGSREGTLCVTEEHMAEAIKTRKYQARIGTEHRSTVIRGWLATAINEGKATLVNGGGQEWMCPRERNLAEMRLRVLQEDNQEGKEELQGLLECEEAKGAVMVWAEENEEPTRDGGPVVLRKERRAQMRTARNRIWTRLGEGSMNATILALSLDGLAVPEVDPPGTDWMWEAARWMTERKWSKETAEEIRCRAVEQIQQMREGIRRRDGQRTWDIVLDLGEGWGSIGTAAEGVECATIGVDRAGILYQGRLHGHIRSRVQMDFAAKTGQNVLQKIARKSETPLSSVMAVWLSPECTLLSRANNMNTSRGCAHGPYAESEKNLAAATPERIEDERRMYAECKQGIEEQMRALEEEQIPFALENPSGSYFWELDSVKLRMEKMPGWRLHEVDQCAYGRLAQKPTKILTNVGWRPRGLTGNGRCKVGRCSGTWGNTPGAVGSRRHKQQTVTNEAERQTRVGEQAKGKKGDYSMEAAKNRVAPMLVQEILMVVRAQKSRRRALEQLKRARTKETGERNETKKRDRSPRGGSSEGEGTSKTGSEAERE